MPSIPSASALEAMWSAVEAAEKAAKRKKGRARAWALLHASDARTAATRAAHKADLAAREAAAAQEFIKVALYWATQKGE